MVSRVCPYTSWWWNGLWETPAQGRDLGQEHLQQAEVVPETHGGGGAPNLQREDNLVQDALRRRRSQSPRLRARQRAEIGADGQVHDVRETRRPEQAQRVVGEDGAAHGHESPLSQMQPSVERIDDRTTRDGQGHGVHGEVPQGQIVFETSAPQGHHVQVAPSAGRPTSA